MDDSNSWVDLLETAKITVEAGMTDRELVTVEERFGFVFAPVHRQLLAAGLPVGSGWVDWRHDPASKIQERFDWPEEGLVFDILNNDFWPRSWGPRPTADEHAVVAARAAIAQLPRLVPIYSHRYVPAAPTVEPTPVFSVYQSDVIYYGSDLSNYLAREFGARPLLGPKPGHVAFWSDLAWGAENEDL